MKKMTAFLALALVLALSVAAQAANKLEEIKQRGTLVAGVKDATPPFGYVDENKQLVGFECDLLAYVAKKMGVKLEMKPVTSSTRIPMLSQGSVDIVAATMTHKLERDDVVDFSITYFMDGQSLLVKKGSSVKSVADLADKKVSTAKGSTSEKNVKEAQPKCNVLSFDDYPQAFLALKQGKVEAMTTDASILIGQKAKDDNPDQWELVGGFFSDEPYAMGVPEDQSKLRDFVNAALMDCWKTGEYKKIYDKWFGKDTKYHIPLTWKMELWP